MRTPKKLIFNAETKSLYAQALLVQGNLLAAKQQIQEALAESPGWFSVRQTSAIIRYFSALSPVVLPKQTPLIPQPIEIGWAKHDDESIEALRQAEQEFGKLADQSESQNEEYQKLRVWQLASLANDFDKQDQAKELCQTLLEVKPVNTEALAWALSRKYIIDLQPIEETLEAQVKASQTPSIDWIVSLANLYLYQGKVDDAVTLLQQTESLFNSQARDIWLLLHTQALVDNQQIEQALNHETLAQNPEIQRQIKIVCLRGLGQQQNNWQPLLDHLETYFQETGNGFYLYECCERKATLHDWIYLADRANLLIQTAQTPGALFLSVQAAWFANRYEQCLKLLEDHSNMFPRQVLPAELRRYKVLCQKELGLLNFAIGEARKLLEEYNATQDLLALMNLHYSQGDYKALAIQARHLPDRKDIHPRQLFSTVRLILSEDRELARKLWRLAVKGDLNDSYAVSEAVTLGYQLELDTEVTPLINLMAKFADHETGGIRSVSLKELLLLGQQWNDRANTIYQEYEKGKIPIHTLADLEKISLVDILHNAANLNQSQLNPFAQFPLFIRYGGRSIQESSIELAPKSKLYLDISALLMGEQLSILDSIEQYFGQLYISTSLTHALSKQRELLTMPQPSRLKASQQLLCFLEQERVQPTQTVSTIDNGLGELAAQMGIEWTAALQQAQTEVAYVVDFLPLMSNDSEMREVTLPESYRERVISCRSLLEAMRQFGAVSEPTYRTALAKLQNDAYGMTAQQLPSRGTKVFLLGGTVSVLADADLLEPLCHSFRVVVDRFEILKAQKLVKEYERRQASLQWLLSLNERVRAGLQRGTYKLIAPRDGQPNREKIDRIQDSSLMTMLDLWQAHIQPGDIIWIDDRLCNSHIQTNGTAIISSYEILQILKDHNQLSDEDYFAKVTQLRSANARYYPVTTQEILHHLRQARIENRQIIETPELAILRRYLAACLLEVDRLQRDPTSEMVRNSYGEGVFVVECLREIADALVLCWQENERTSAEIAASADWILQNLFFGSLGGQHLVQKSQGDSETYKIASLDLCGGFGKGILLPHNEFEKSTQKQSLRQKYFKWFEARVADSRFKANPETIGFTGQLLSEFLTFSESSFEPDNNVDDMPTDSLMKAEAWRLAANNFYLSLPEVLRQSIAEQFPEQIRNLGIEFNETINIGTLRFDSHEFWSAAEQAILVGTAEVGALYPNEEFTVEAQQISDSEEKFLIIRNEPLSIRYRFDDPIVAMLSSDLSVRKTAFTQNLQWFDCDGETREQLILELTQIEQVHDRLKRYFNWRKNSASYFYENLADRIQQSDSLDLSDLIPSSGKQFLQYFRLNTSNVDQDFPSGVAHNLVQALDLESTIERIACFPCQLPNFIIENLRLLPVIERQSLLEKCAAQWLSPVCKLHLIDLAFHFIEDGNRTKALLTTLIQDLLSDDGSKSVRLFQAILKWVNYQFSFWEDAKSWSAPIRLAAIWAHASKVQNLFNVEGLIVEELAESFGVIDQNISADFFKHEPAFWNDILHPQRFHETAFLVHGFSAIAQGHTVELLQEIGLIDPILRLATRSVEEETMVNPHLFGDPTLAQNSLNSWYGFDRGDLLIPLIGQDIGGQLTSDSIRSFIEAMLDTLLTNPTAETSWLVILGVVGTLPLYEDLREKLIRLIQQTNFADLLTEKASVAFLALITISSQIRYLDSAAIQTEVENKIIQIVAVLNERNQQNAVTSDLAGQILESVFRLAIQPNDPYTTSKRFSSLLIQAIHQCPKLAEHYDGLFRFALELSVEQIEGLWLLILNIRALRQH